MDKIKVLVINVSNAGVGKFRFSDPHKALDKQFKDEFHVDMVTNPPIHDKNFSSQYDMVVAQSALLLKDDVYNLFEGLKRDGMKLVFDVDDYWRLSRTHAMYRKMENQWKTLTSRFKIADMITTTTKFLAAKIRKYNKNVAILPNAIDPKEKQFKTEVVESEKIRVGWLGGSSHLEDLKLLKNMANQVITSKGVDTQMIMCGFNNLSRDINTGKLTKVEKPKVWLQCEYIFTAGYLNMDEKYIHYLLHPKEQQYPNVKTQPYKRIWTKPIQSYATGYNEIDIAVAPLVDNKFNKMKSPLKVIEAGFHKKPLIASDVAPYQLDCIHKENALLVPEKKAHKLFPKYAKQLINSESMRKELGEALYETVKDKYDLSKVTNKRAQLYKSIIK